MLVGLRPSGDVAENNGHGWIAQSCAYSIESTSARQNGVNAYVVAQRSDTDSLRNPEGASQIFGAGQRRNGEADNDQEADKVQTECLLNELCARLSDVRKESGE
jgi:hypothetical protein